MKILLERLNFSIEKPQKDKEYIAFKLKASSPSPTYGMLLHLCGQANANLYYIGDIEIDECLDVLNVFDKKAKKEMERKGVDYLVCHFWLGKEQGNTLTKKGSTCMKTLLERSNFSTEKPLNGEQFHTFKVDSAVLVDIFSTFCLFCEELKVNLDDVELNDFNSSVDSFEDYYKNTRMEISLEGIDEVTCYFWVEGG